MTGRTSVVVAHRLSTIRNANSIAVVYRCVCVCLCEELETRTSVLSAPAAGACGGKSVGAYLWLCTCPVHAHASRPPKLHLSGRQARQASHKASATAVCGCCCCCCCSHFVRGVILEQGTHQELLAIPHGGYARLVAAQMKGGGESKGQ